MAKTVGIGIQSFDKVIEGNYFYIDKTSFIKEWWESGDDVTLITRPRRFGKTLNMSMLEYFFSNQYAGRGDLFEGLSIWKDEKYRKLQGTYPVISLSFARVKESSYPSAKARICRLIAEVYNQHWYLVESDVLKENEKTEFIDLTNKKTRMSEEEASTALNNLSGYLYRYYGKKVIILLDEYDTPMQEAYLSGFWDELVSFTRSLFNSTFKTNPYMARSIMTGITRVSKESIFSDLNNLEVVTATSDAYATSFGFTEEEVFHALDDYGYGDRKGEVKRWYDGFIFGEQRDIYNPWSIINYLAKGKIDTYWANSSGNGLVSRLIREGNRKIKDSFEILLKGGTISCPIDEQIVYNQLDRSEEAVWSLLLASGYLKVLSAEEKREAGTRPIYCLQLTNEEVRDMFYDMVRDWFAEPGGSYNDFVEALLAGDLDAMNEYMNRVAMRTFSYFDTAKDAAQEEPEKFYHGFALGLMVDLSDRYVVTSNRESGFGRYDVMIEPKDKGRDAFILEFKVRNARREASLEETVQSALAQIEEKNYAASLAARGIPEGKIRKYGFAFQGKEVLIGEA